MPVVLIVPGGLQYLACSMYIYTSHLVKEETYLRPNNEPFSLNKASPTFQSSPERRIHVPFSVPATVCTLQTIRFALMQLGLQRKKIYMDLI